jgi:SAM-dependent methyltransferase
MGDWIAFWDSAHAIYVNAHHRDVHYRRIAEDIRRYVPAGGLVLDYGCGDALHADRLTTVARRLVLCEAAPKLCATLAAHFADHAKIEVRSPEQVAALADRTFDLIVVHSVAQYLTAQELDALLALFRRLLKTDGRLVLGDIIPPQVSALTDAFALLRFASDEGFLGAAFLGLIRTVLSNYWRLRTTLGLTRYAEAGMLGKLTAAGFSATRAPANIGHNPARMTFLARPA